MDCKRIIVRRILIRLGIFLLLIGGISYCSNPINSSSGNDILNKLLSVPEIAIPLETVENASNPGYLKTVEYLRNIQSYQKHNYIDMILPFIKENIKPRKINNAWEWRRNSDFYPEMIVVLTIIPGDTLFFDFTREGPDSGPSDVSFISGRHIPLLQQGWISIGGAIDVVWWLSEYGNNLGIRRPDFSVIGFNHVALDSTNGGGSLSWDKGVPFSIKRFEAGWDAVGHGNWWSDEYGSGEW